MSLAEKSKISLSKCLAESLPVVFHLHPFDSSCPGGSPWTCQGTEYAGPQNHLIWICPRAALLLHQFLRPLEVGVELWAWNIPIPSQQVMGAVGSPRTGTCNFCPLFFSANLRLPMCQMFLDVFNVSIMIWTGLCFTMAEFSQLTQEPYYLLVNSG